MTWLFFITLDSESRIKRIFGFRGFFNIHFFYKFAPLINICLIQLKHNFRFMAVLKAFKGFRPPVNISKELASRPYDVLNSKEARVEAEGNQYSLLHIIKPEIDLPEDTYL